MAILFYPKVLVYLFFFSESALRCSSHSQPKVSVFRRSEERPKVSPFKRSEESHMSNIQPLAENFKYEGSTDMKTELKYNTTFKDFRFKDPEISQIKSVAELKKFISENINSLTPEQIVDILDKYHYYLDKEKW